MACIGEQARGRTGRIWNVFNDLAGDNVDRGGGGRGVGRDAARRTRYSAPILHQDQEPAAAAAAAAAAAEEEVVGLPCVHFPSALFEHHPAQAQSGTCS